MKTQAKKALQDIWMAATQKAVYKAFDDFINKHQLKYPKSVPMPLEG